MDHAGNLSFVFCLDWNTVAAVSHGDHRILQVIAGAAVYQGGKLCVNAVVGNFYAAAHMHQSAAGVIADLILGKDAAADLRGERSQRLQALEHAVKGILSGISALVAGICFDTVGIFKKSGNGKQLGNSQRASDLQALQGAPHILHASKGNVSLLEKAGEGISCLGLHMTDLINIFRWEKVFAQVFSHRGRSLLGQLVDDLVIFK